MLLHSNLLGAWLSFQLRVRYATATAADFWRITQRRADRVVAMEVAPAVPVRCADATRARVGGAQTSGMMFTKPGVIQDDTLLPARTSGRPVELVG